MFNQFSSQIKRATTRAKNEYKRQYERAVSRISGIALKIRKKLHTHRKKSKNANYRKEQRERLTIVGLGATAFFTFVTAIIFYCQLNEMRKVYGPVKISADAAKQSADAVGNIERPYLFIEARPSQNVPKNGPFPTDDGTPTIIYKVTNMGPVPAVIRSAYIECFVKNTLPLPPIYSAKKMRGALTAIGSNITNNSFPPCVLDSKITAFDWAALKTNNENVFFVAWMIYEGALNATYISGVAFRIDPFTGDTFPTFNAEYNYDRTVQGRVSEGAAVPIPNLVP